MYYYIPSFSLGAPVLNFVVTDQALSFPTQNNDILQSNKYTDLLQKRHPIQQPGGNDTHLLQLFGRRWFQVSALFNEILPPPKHQYTFIEIIYLQNM